ncbi:hypothetical protein [Nitrosomonas sp. Nm58]|jgi:hypothetical protein|uniref:hypothetical protein n=1 Tax=Nitrosomonas sp. Nm58 TaxID=200126 RepID=UPI000B8843E4|nr:hypothetical protein [Nitrosomonas sp. Nm58]
MDALGSGKHRLTEAYSWFLAGWAKRLSRKEVAQAFHTTWDHVFSSVERVVVWGRGTRICRVLRRSVLTKLLGSEDTVINAGLSD